MRLVVMAYQDIGYVCLDELFSLGADVAAVVTHQDDPHEAIWFRSVAERARSAGVPVLEPASVNSPEVVDEIARLAPDMILSFYFREILSRDILALPSQGLKHVQGSAHIDVEVFNGVDQAGGHFLPLAGALPTHERRAGAHGGIRAGDEIGQRWRGARGRLVFRAVHAHESAHRLRDEVE